MDYRLIAEEKPHHPVSRLARVLGVSRAGFYAWQKRPPSERARADAALAERITQIHSETEGIYGAPRIHAELADEDGIRVGRKRVARLMRAAGIEGVSRRRFRVGTTTPGGEAPAAPDLVQRDFTAERPNQLWFADITCVPTWQGWLYLAAVIDACSRYCVGWSMRDDLKADLVYDALGMAVTRRKPDAELVHHSDRGGQYRSLVFGKLLRESGIMPSMGSRGDAYDNAAMESFMASIKTELINRRRFKAKDEARSAIFAYIEAFCNPRRRHQGLGQKSPAAYEKMLQTAQLEATDIVALTCPLKRGNSNSTNAATVNVLRRVSQQQLDDAKSWGEGWKADGHVFVREDGDPWHPDRITKLFAQTVKAVEVPRIRLHDLRHTWATLALRAGVHPKVVQERLGHSNISITLDTYSHLLPDMQESAAEMVAALVDLSDEE